MLTPHRRSDLPSCQFAAGGILDLNPKSSDRFHLSRATKRGVAHRHERWVRMRWTRAMSATNDVVPADGEVVWS